MPDKSLSGICGYELFGKSMRSKILSKRILLTAVLTGFVLFPVLIFASTNVFARTLRVGMRGEDVRELQKFLNTDTETRVASAGVGSAGNETDYFGPATKRALIQFQEKYRTEVLTPLGLTSGTGILGTKTREKISTLSETTRSAITPKTSNQSDSALIIENATAILNPEQATSGLPVRLKIPKINVDAPVEYVGLTSDGAIDAPKGPVNVAWFSLGPRPGESGSAVIVGHYGWKNSIPAAFDNLSRLRKGDKIYVEDEKGETITFVVRELRSFDENGDASVMFGSTDDKAHLNLVTCGGVWNKARKSYSNRLIAFTDKE